MCLDCVHLICMSNAEYKLKFSQVNTVKATSAWKTSVRCKLTQFGYKILATFDEKAEDLKGESIGFAAKLPTFSEARQEAKKILLEQKKIVSCERTSIRYWNKMLLFLFGI